MKDLKEYIFENVYDIDEMLIQTINDEMFSEALQSNLLRELAQSLLNTPKDKWYNQNSSFKRTFGNSGVKWNEVKDSDFESYSSTESNKAKSAVRKILQDKTWGMAFIFDGDSDDLKYFITTYGRVYDKGGNEMTNGYSRRSTRDLTQGEKCSLCDGNTVKILDFTNFSTRNLETERRKAKAGIIYSHDENYLKNYADAQVRRYKDIIAKQRAEKLAEEDETIYEINTIVNKVMKISITISDDMVKYADQVSNLERLILKLYSEKRWVDRTRWRKESGYEGQDGLLKLMSRYIRLKKDLSESSERHYVYNDSESEGERKMKELKAHKNAIDKMIKEIKDLIQIMGF